MRDQDDFFNDYAPDEDIFWQEMIIQWEAENPGPAPMRMYEALEQAKHRQQRAQNFISAQASRPH